MKKNPQTMISENSNFKMLFYSLLGPLIAYVLDLNDLTQIELRLGRVGIEAAMAMKVKINTTFILMQVNNKLENNMMFFGDDPTGNDQVDYTNLFNRVLKSVITKTEIRGSYIQDLSVN